MNQEEAEKQIATMERARGQKWKAFGFCCLGLFLGLYLFLNPYEKDLMPLVHERTVFVQYLGVFISIFCGPLALFFLISLPTKIWERICDWQIKKIRAAINE